MNVYTLLSILKHRPYGAGISELVKEISQIQYSEHNKKEYHKLYMRIYRTVKRYDDIFIVEKHNNLTAVRLTAKAFDLLNAVVKLKKRKNSIYAVPVRAHENRRQAVLETMKHATGNEHLEMEWEFLFDDYKEDISQKKIVLKAREDAITDKQFLFLDYKTRFTDASKIKQQLDNYDSVWEQATARYKHAVYMILTTDPKRHKSLWHANRHFSPAWNHFRARLKQLTGRRHDYIIVTEYTKKTKLMHAHVIFFGTKFLLPHRKITELWEECNQGSYNYVYHIVNNRGRWQWTKSKPATRSQNPSAYMKKYLKKALFDSNAAVAYWVFNKRFFTHSRTFTITTQQKTTLLQPCYIYIGTFTIRQMPLHVYEAYKTIYTSHSVIEIKKELVK